MRRPVVMGLCPGFVPIDVPMVQSGERDLVCSDFALDSISSPVYSFQPHRSRQNFSLQNGDALTDNQSSGIHDQPDAVGRWRDVSSLKERRKEMEKQNIVVTFTTSPEDKALFLETLGSEASFGSLTFLNEIPPAQREQVLERAHILLSWNFPREIHPQDYPHLQQV